MTKHFQDTSSFQGVIEFTADNGGSYRATSEGSGIWGVGKFEDGAFVRCATVNIDGKATPRKIFDAISAQ